MLQDGIKGFCGVLLSVLAEYGDYGPITGQNHFNLGCSGYFAAWCAWYLGGDPVILCGMGLYQGKKFYLDSDNTPKKDAGTLNFQKKEWGRIFDYCENLNIRAVSGPLIDVFGQY